MICSILESHKLNWVYLSFKEDISVKEKKLLKLDD